MRQVPNGKRSRNRPGRNNNRPQNSRNQSFDSSGPEGKVRGTANQVYEKYLALARDASSSGDRVAAENFYQHAEHYFRIMVASGQQMNPRPVNAFGDEGFDAEDGDEGDDQRAFVPGGPQPQAFQPQHGQPQHSQGPRQPNGQHNGQHSGQPPAAPQPVRTQPPAPSGAQPTVPVPAQAHVQPQPVVVPPPADRQPKTPAELAQAAAANANVGGAPAVRTRERVRRPGRRGTGDTPVEA